MHSFDYTLWGQRQWRESKDWDLSFSTTNSMINYQCMRVFILKKLKFVSEENFKIKSTKQTGLCGFWGAATVQLDSKFNFSKVMLFTLCPH